MNILSIFLSLLLRLLFGSERTYSLVRLNTKRPHEKNTQRKENNKSESIVCGVRDSDGRAAKACLAKRRKHKSTQPQTKRKEQNNQKRKETKPEKQKEKKERNKN
jgi:hypothetical protein